MLFNTIVVITTVQRVYFEGINVRGFRGLGMYREFNIPCMHAAKRRYSTKIKTFLKAFPRKFIPSKYIPAIRQLGNWKLESSTKTKKFSLADEPPQVLTAKRCNCFTKNLWIKTLSCLYLSHLFGVQIHHSYHMIVGVGYKQGLSLWPKTQPTRL